MAGRAGEVYAPLSDSQLSDDWAMNIFPNTHWSTHAEGLLSLEYLPHPTDPLRCRVHIMVLGHRGMQSDGFSAIRLSEQAQVLRHQHAELSRLLG